MRENLAQRVLEGFVAFSSLSGFALPAGFQDKSTGTNAGASPAAVASDNLQGLPAPRLTPDASLTPVSTAKLDSSGCSFVAGSQAIGLHIKIANAVSGKRPVTFGDVNKLFETLKKEQGNTLTEKFYASYANAFREPEVRALVEEYVLATGKDVDLRGDPALPGGNSSNSENRSKLTSPAVATFLAVDRQAIVLTGFSFKGTGASFATNSQAQKIHQTISAEIQQGKPISAASIKALFIAFSQEDIGGLNEAFFEAYAKKFNNYEATKLMVDSIIPVVDGRRALPRGPETTPRLAALRILGNCFPERTPIETRRNFFESLHNEPDLNVRALSLMLCINSNIAPAAHYKPSEIIRASQQLGNDNRLRADEFRLATMLRDSLMTWAPQFSVTPEVLNPIKVALLRSAITDERRHPGIAEALTAISEDAYVEFLSEHAKLLQDSRNAFSQEEILGAGEKLYGLMHSSKTFHPGIIKDLAEAFRSNFDSEKNVIKGASDPTSAVAENAYFDLIRSLASGEKVRIIISSHGNPDGIFFWEGEAEQIQQAKATNSEPLPTEFISCEEDAAALLKAGDLSNTWILQSTCQGWNYCQRVNEILIEDALKKMPLERVLKELTLPGRIIATQRDMRSVGLIAQFTDTDLPHTTQSPVDVHYSLLHWGIMLYCQAAAEGKQEEDLESIGPNSDVPFKLTGADMLVIDQRLSDALEAKMKQWWNHNQGKLHEPSNTQAIDPSIQSSKLIDPDARLNLILENLKNKGYDLPKNESEVKPISRPSDLIDEFSHWQPLWPNGATWS